MRTYLNNRIIVAERYTRPLISLVCGFALLSLGMGAGNPVLADQLTPVAQRITDEAIERDLTAYAQLQKRIDALHRNGLPMTTYHMAKAQAWLDFSKEEYEENDRTDICETTYDQALQLVELLEQQKTPLPMDTPLVSHSVRLRDDLWLFVEQTKQHKKFACVAQLEIELVLAGHEAFEQEKDDAQEALEKADILAQDIRKILAPHTLIIQLIPPADMTTELTDRAGTVVACGNARVASDDYEALTVTNDAPARFPLGATKVIWTAKDSEGHAALGVQTITVVDTTPPLLAVPADVTAEATARVGSVVAYGTATATDIADPHPLVTNDAPKLFPMGKTIVTWKAVDAFGNATQAQQTVTVVDTTPPVITVPGDITKEATSIAANSLDIGQATASDLIDPLPVISNDAPTVFPVGATIVTWTAKDAAGNEAKAQQRIVVADTTPPVLHLPADQQIFAGKLKSDTLPGIATAVDLVDPTPMIGNNAPAHFPVGTTTVTWWAKDRYGNTATAVQMITITDNTSGLQELISRMPDRVHFAVNQAIISRQTAKVLQEEVIPLLKAHGDITLQLVGHADQRGSSAYNMALALKRADAVKQFLVKNGIIAERISVISVGKEQPLTPGTSITAYAYNRAVQLIYTSNATRVQPEMQSTDLQIE